MTGGTWLAHRTAGRVDVGLDVTERWQPGRLPLLIRVVTTVVPVFRRWPPTYRSRATLHQDGSRTAAWTRTGTAGADSYRKATGTR